MANPGKIFRDVYSTILLTFCTFIIMSTIFLGNTTISKSVSPWLSFVLIWGGLLWLSMVEGGQASLVGLPPVDMNLYKNSHPTSHQIMTVVNKGDNLDRYLMGRQFLVLALVFLENLAGHPSNPDLQIFGLPIWVNKALIHTGLALFFMTAMIGKISAQVNASRCMLDYVNNTFALGTMWVSMMIEMSGLLHCCYLAQILFAKAAGQPLESKEEPRTSIQQLFFWGRVLLSLAILVFAFTVTLTALFDDRTTMWEGVHPWITVILFFFFMSIVGMLEGMQIAFFAVAKMSEEDRGRSSWAKRTCDVLFAKNGRNLPGFMVGRQMCVTLCFFVIARVTTITPTKDGEDNILGFEDGIQKFFETGLLGALITTIVASIMWQLVASSFPMAFLSTPITYILLRWCLFLEWTGLCQGSWVFAMILRKIAGYKRDEVYIGTAEERKAKHQKDPTMSKDDAEYNVVPGHLYPGVPVLPPNFAPRMNTIDEINDLEKELKAHKQDVDNRLAELHAQKEKLRSNDVDV